MPKQDYDAPCRPEDDKADQMEVAPLVEFLKEPTSDDSIANVQAAGLGTEPKPHYGDNAAEPTTKSSPAETDNGDNEWGSKLQETERMEIMEGGDNEEVRETSRW